MSVAASSLIQEAARSASWKAVTDAPLRTVRRALVIVTAVQRRTVAKRVADLA